VDEFAGWAISLVAIYADNSEVVLHNQDERHCRMETMKVCREQLLELTSNPNEVLSELQDPAGTSQ
jgi:hypothetical protein